MEKEDKQSEEDLSIDFSRVGKKIKNFFNKTFFNKTEPAEKVISLSPHSHAPAESEELSLDFDKVKDFAKKNAKWLIPLLLIVIAFSFSFYLRTMPERLPITDDWAQSTVYNFYKGQIANQIGQQYPNLPEANKQIMVDKEFQNTISQNKDAIDQQITSTSERFKAQLQDSTGQTYLVGIDPYLWYGMAKNYLKYGQMGNAVDENGDQRYTLRNGREGYGMNFHFHTFIIVVIYNIVHFFDGNINLMTGQLFFTVLISSLAVIPAYFFVFRLTKSKFAGFLSGLLIGSSPFILQRTAEADTDPWNVLMPIAVACLFVYAYTEKNTLRKIIYSVATALAVTIYSLAWSGWFHIFDFVLATILVTVIITAIRTKKVKEVVESIKVPLLIIASFLVLRTAYKVPMSGLSLFGSLNEIFQAVLGPLWYVTYKQVGTSSLWPNVLTTVAELNPGSIEGVIGAIGGKIFFVLALLGMNLLLLPSEKWNKKDYFFFGITTLWIIFALYLRSSINNPVLIILFLGLPIIVRLVWLILAREPIEIEASFFLVIWLLGTTYAALSGLRFIALAAIPLTLGLAVFFGLFYRRTAPLLSKNLNINLTVTKGIIMVLVLLAVISPLQQAYAVSKNEVPNLDDAWYDSLTKIKDATTEAIITSWWDFGHWFVAIAERRVTFDGGDQGERIYWVGRTLLTSDENTSVGLLRMLNCGQQKAVHAVEKYANNNTIRAVEITNQIMALNNKDKAIKYLQSQGFTAAQISEISKYTYCDNLLDQFFITSEDMVGKAGVWGHFGSWDFNRAAMYLDTYNLKYDEGIKHLINKYNFTESQAGSIYNEIQSTPADQWISPWPGYIGSGSCVTVSSDNNLDCTFETGQGSAKMQINLQTMNAAIPAQGKTFYPNSLVYAAKSGIEERKFSGDLLGFSVILMPENNKLVLTHPLQARSMFTQLFFLKGQGLKCFQKFDERTQFTGGKIIVWKVDWNCQQKNLIYFQPQEQVHAKHILISVQNRLENEALDLANKIDAEINASNFETIAKKYSEDPGSKDKGGDLGWFGKGEMVPEFEQAAFALKPGEISKPIKTKFGYHLIKLIERKNE